MKILILLSLILFSIHSQAIDYKQLEHCMTSLRWSPPDGKYGYNHIKEKVPDSKFLGTLTNGSRTSYTVNALLIPEKTASGTKLHVIQDPNIPSKKDTQNRRVQCLTAGIQQTFTIPKTAIQSRCSHKDSGGANLALGGSCHGPQMDWMTKMKPVKVTLGQNPSREETNICHNIFSRNDERPLRGSQLDSAAVTKLVQNAIAERLKFMAEQGKKKNIKLYEKNVINAIKPGGYCEKAVPKSVESIILAADLLCVVDPKQENGCLKGDTDYLLPGAVNSGSEN